MAGLSANILREGRTVIDGGVWVPDVWQFKMQGCMADEQRIIKLAVFRRSPVAMVMFETAKLYIRVLLAYPGPMKTC